MKKIYDVSQLLKPVRFVEQDSDATEAEDVDNIYKDNDNKDKKDGSDKESKDGEGSGNEEGSSNAEGSGNGEGSQNSEGSGKEEGSGNQEGQDNNADSTKQALIKAQQEITACGDELDKIYKNNNLKKYGKDVTSLYQNGSKFIWVGAGIAVAALFTFLCVKGIISIKQALPKIPLVGRLFQGDKAAIKDVSNTIGVPGSNPAQKTDEAPTIENSVEAQANAKVGDVIQRKDGSKYKLNQGDIDWAKKQQQAGKGKETVDQAKQEDSGNQNNGEGIAGVAQQVEQAASDNNNQSQNSNPTNQQQNNQFQNVKNNKKIMSEMNNQPTTAEFESMGRMKQSGDVKFSPLGKGWELAISGNMAMVYNQFGHVVYAGRPGDAVIKEIPEWLKTINLK